MNPFAWLVVAALLFHAARSAVDIGLDRVRAQRWPPLAWTAGALLFGALVWALAWPQQAPVAITASLAAAANGAKAWLLRDLPRDTLPPVRY